MKITDDVRAYAAERGYAEGDTQKVLEERSSVGSLRGKVGPTGDLSSHGFLFCSGMLQYMTSRV